MMINIRAFYKPIYPVQKHMQRWFDFFRHWANFEFITHECVQQNVPDMFDDRARLREEGILTIHDLGLKPEDFWYWETKLCEPFFDRFAPAMEHIDWKRKQTGWGGPIPTTEQKTVHSGSIYGWRQVNKGMYNRDWYSTDAQEYDWSAYEPEFPVTYGSDIDGRESYQHFIEKYNDPRQGRYSGYKGN